MPQATSSWWTLSFSCPCCLFSKLLPVTSCVFGCSLTQFKHQSHTHTYSYHISSQIPTQSPAPSSLWATVYFLARSEVPQDMSLACPGTAQLTLPGFQCHFPWSPQCSLPGILQTFSQISTLSEHSQSKTASQFTTPSSLNVILHRSHHLPVLHGGVFSIVFLSRRTEETQVKLFRLFCLVH